MPWARASALDRHVACPAASHLPRYDRGAWERGYLHGDGVFVAPDVSVVDRDTFAADWGTAMHAAKASAPEAVDPFLTWLEPHRENLWPDRLGVHEVAMSYDCSTEETELFFSEWRDMRDAWKASMPDDCVVGETDWWAELPSGMPWIDDLKTGWKKPPVLTPQMLFYGMVALKEHQKAGGTFTAVQLSITHWPRAKTPTEPSRDGLWYQATEIALLAFEGELKQAWVRATRANPEPRPGDHCGYCPSANICDKANI